MTIYHICAVRDSALGAYATPIFVPSTGLAVRSFQDEVNRVDANNALNKHPGDFELFVLGTYEDSTGEFTTTTPMSLALGSRLKTAS